MISLIIKKIFKIFLILNAILFAYLSIRIYSNDREKDLTKSIKKAFFGMQMGYTFFLLGLNDFITKKISTPEQQDYRINLSR